jgi:tetratricopeptide (TPR) repeat protein
MIVMFLGIAQKINPEYLLNRGSDRVASTLGNAIYYSGYGLFLFFLGAMLFFVDYGQRRLWAWLAATASAIGFVGIFLGGTRGTMIGGFFGILVACILYAIYLREYPRMRKMVFSLIGVGALAVVLLFATRQTAFVSGLPGLGRLLNTDVAHIGDNTRVMAWGVAIDAWKEKPLLGWGPNNFYYAFNKYYRPEFLRYGWGETWFDNAHNIIMNTLATQGIFGLMVYVAVFAVGIWSLTIAYKKQRVPMHVMVFGIGFLVAHLIHNIFVFENPTSYLYFSLFLAFITAETQASDTNISGDKSRVRRDVSWPVVFVVGLMAIFVLYTTDINPKRANNATLMAIQRVYGAPESAAAAFASALVIPTPHIDDIRNDMARTASEVADNLVSQGKTDVAKTLVVAAYDELEKNLILHPLDVRVDVELAQLAIRRAELYQDPQYIYEAEKLYENALAESPKRQQIQYALLGIKLQLGKNADAVALAETALNNDKQVPEAWWRLAWVYGIVGDKTKASNVIKEARAIGMKFSDQGEQLIAPFESATST